MNTYLLDTSVIIDVLNSQRARDNMLLHLPIAAVAHKLILITDNRKHYPMPDLRLFEESPRR